MARDLHGLVTDGRLDEATADKLSSLLEAGKAVIITGGATQDQLELMKAMMASLPDSTRTMLTTDASGEARYNDEPMWIVAGHTSDESMESLAEINEETDAAGCWADLLSHRLHTEAWGVEAPRGLEAMAWLRLAAEGSVKCFMTTEKLHTPEYAVIAIAAEAARGDPAMEAKCRKALADSAVVVELDWFPHDDSMEDVPLAVGGIYSIGTDDENSRVILNSLDVDSIR